MIRELKFKQQNSSIIKDRLGTAQHIKIGGKVKRPQTFLSRALCFKGTQFPHQIRTIFVYFHSQISTVTWLKPGETGCSGSVGRLE